MWKATGEGIHAMKDRGKINLVIDLLMFIDFALIGGIGFLIKYTLPPGRERILKYGENTELFFLGLDRHQWGTIHLTAAYVIIGLLVLHVVFHWGTIKVLVRKTVPSLRLRWALVTGFVILATGLLLFSFAVKPEKAGQSEYLHRNFPHGRTHDYSDVKAVPESSVPGEGEKTEESSRHEEQKAPAAVHEEHGGHEGAEALQGRMTVIDAAKLYGLSAAEVKQRLGVPGDVSDYETIGRLRRIYGFSMTQARERLGENL